MWSTLFSAKAFYLAFEGPPQPRASCVLVWLGLVPPWAKVLSWLVVVVKVSTVDNSRRGMVANNILDFCVVCNKTVESINHLFTHYKVASLIWSHFINVCGFLGCFLFCGCFLGPGCRLIIWTIIPLAILRSIWQERNERIFRGSSSMAEAL